MLPSLPIQYPLELAVDSTVKPLWRNVQAVYVYLQRLKEALTTQIADPLQRVTTAERDSLQPTDGLLIYNTTLGKFQGYEAGAWVNLV